MDKLESIRERQKSNIERQLKRAEKKENRPKRKRKKKSRARRFFKTICLLALMGVILLAAAVCWATWGMDFDFSDSFSRLGMNLSSIVYYVDENDNQIQYERLIADENRIWVDYEDIPDNMKNAFVAIEDQRFYKHRGVDIKRTAGAVLNVITNGDSSYGGSTITQQLVKNITEDSEHSKARKIREMVRAVILETKLEKKDILELYMNSIYLGHGANGVQAASHAYFGKDVSELSLVECTAIAGITQHPSTYDPIINPEGNKEKRALVLNKMYELGYIDKQEYDDALNRELVTNPGTEENAAQSYFVDCLFEELLEDLISAKGYTKAYATDLIYNGGLKIISTVDPKIQSIMDDVYANGNGFPKFYGETPQSAMIISDPSNGQIKGIVGGTGKKTGARVLNRATQTKRQPGSTMKPISVYGPAIDTGVITIASTVENSPLDINGWTPKNANNKFSEPVSIRKAVASSLNLPAIRILEELTVDVSFDYLNNRLHMDLIESQKTDDGVSSDKAYAPLALGGLTEGITVEKMNSAYASFANGGVYVQPTSYTKVYDSAGNLILNKTSERNAAFSEETAFIVNQLLKGVVDSGTASGNAIRGIDTCGKTGSTDDNKDRWFVGYTPYYAGTVWVGYDEPKVISYAGVNPALTIWKAVMDKVHSGYAAKTFECPEFVERVYICSNSGQYGTSRCRGSTDYANIKLINGYCSGIHNKQIGTHGEYIPEASANSKKKSDTTGSSKANTANEQKSSGTNEGGENAGTSTGNEGSAGSNANEEPLTAEGTPASNE